MIMDDTKARREARKRGCEPLWLLQVLDEAAERGFIDDISQKLEHLQHQTTFYMVKARVVVEDMKQRDSRRKQAQEQHRTTDDQGSSAPESSPEPKED